MKKIIFFYLLCCLSIILIWLAIDDYDIKSKDFRFGFYVLIFVACAIYAPIFTVSAIILYYSNVSKAILANKYFSILYCIFPFLCFKIIGVICIHTGIRIGYRIEYCIPIVFIIQNVIIIIKKIT
jgi:hypothetical protein